MAPTYSIGGALAAKSFGKDKKKKKKLWNQDNEIKQLVERKI